MRPDDIGEPKVEKPTTKRPSRARFGAAEPWENAPAQRNRDEAEGTSLATRRLNFAPEIVLVGASTGGPQALIALITGLAPHLDRIQVCVTLHMPADLMPVIAAHVARVCRVATCVVTERRMLKAGLVHFSPGSQHLAIERVGQGVAVSLTAGTSRDFCMPAIDMMFLSGARAYGPRALAIVLSGMGKDGLAGSRSIVEAGGVVLAQDEASSAVWGMPGAVAKADLASAVLEPVALARDVIARLRPMVTER